MTSQPPPVPDPPAFPPPPPPRQFKWDKTTKQTAAWITGCVVLFAIVIVGGILLSGPGALNHDGGRNGGGGAGYQPPDVADSSQVEQVCHDQANDLLKAPATSKFGGDVVTGSEPRYTDTGYVDSENGFGALIRTNYVCTAIHGSGVNFQVKVDFIQQ